MCALALLWSASAWATPLVHDGDAERAASVAQERLGAGEREPVGLEQVRAGAPSLLSGGQAIGCQGDASDVEEVVSSLESALVFADVDKATPLVDEARDAVLCSATPTGAPTLARIEVLAGVLAELTGDAESARARFLAAVGYDPEVAWIDAFPPQRRVRFDEARQAERPAAVPLQIHPSRDVTVDGRPASADVAAGEHVVHVGGTGVRVVLEPGYPDTLVVPRAFPADALTWMEDDVRRADLTDLLAAEVDEGVAAVVVTGDVAWTGTTGRVDWTAHRPAAVPMPDPLPAPMPEPVPGRRSAAPLVLSGVGSVAAVTGAVLAVTGASAARSAAEAADGLPSGGLYEGHRDDYRAGATRAYVGYGLLGAGGICGGIGLALAL